MLTHTQPDPQAAAYADGPDHAAAMNAPETIAAARLTLPVHGMSCASCVAHVEKALAAVPGVAAVAVNLATESATVQGSGLDAEALRRAVDEAGYEVPAETLQLAIEGMTCASCVARVEKALAAVPGVLRASVNLASESARLEVVRGAVSARALVAAVQEAGYTARLETGHGAAAAARDPAAAMKRDVIVALVLAAPLAAPMLFALLGVPLSLPPWLQWLLATMVQGTGLSGTDRFLGFLFGSARGVLACIIALIVLRPFAEGADWWQVSVLVPELLAFEDDILNLLGKATDWVSEIDFKG